MDDIELVGNLERSGNGGLTCLLLQPSPSKQWVNSFRNRVRNYRIRFLIEGIRMEGIELHVLEIAKDPLNDCELKKLEQALREDVAKTNQEYR